MVAVKTFQREVDLYPPVLKLFRARALVFAEVPYYSKRVDLIFSSRDLRSLVAVELKLLDWRRALKQAALNQVFTQLSYVALPSYVVGRFDERKLDIFTRHELGLISVFEDKAVIVIKAVRTEFFSSLQAAVVKKALKGASGILSGGLV